MHCVSGIIAAVLLALCAGCQTPQAPGKARLPVAQWTAEDRTPGVSVRSFYVVSNGWHTGIVLGRSDLADSVIFEIHDFPMAEYFEFSWGDARYFPSPDKGLGVAMSALFAPTPAVIHVAGLPAHPREVFPGAETVELQVTPEGFQNLVTYLDDTFKRDAAASSIPGLYPFSRFYPAKGRFHMFNTCNTWTARGLAAAGIRVTVSGTLQAEELMTQLR
ncbi:MAG TPA: DUF2459 domain-containing protein [Gammaproteobacteria bacterium]|nr:DUF2459 domain-containing protein [Gammaproteobacteria bacterium]